MLFCPLKRRPKTELHPFAAPFCGPLLPGTLAILAKARPKPIVLFERSVDGAQAAQKGRQWLAPWLAPEPGVGWYTGTLHQDGFLGVPFFPKQCGHTKGFLR